MSVSYSLATTNDFSIDFFLSYWNVLLRLIVTFLQNKFF